MTEKIEFEIRAGQIKRRSSGLIPVEKQGVFRIYSDKEGRHFCWIDSATTTTFDDCVFNQDEFVSQPAPNTNGHMTFTVENKASQRRHYYFLQDESNNLEAVCQTLNTFFCSNEPEYSYEEDLDTGEIPGEDSECSSQAASEMLSSTSQATAGMALECSFQAASEMLSSTSQATAGTADVNIPPSYFFLYPDNKFIEKEISKVQTASCPERDIGKEVDSKRGIRKELEKISDGQLMMLLKNQTRKSHKAAAAAESAAAQPSPAEIVQSTNFRENHEAFVKDVLQKCNTQALIPVLVNNEVRAFLNLMLPIDQQLPESESAMRDLIGSSFMSEVLRVFISAFASRQLETLCSKIGLADKKVEAAKAGDVVEFIRLIESDAVEREQQKEREQPRNSYFS